MSCHEIADQKRGFRSGKTADKLGKLPGKRSKRISSCLENTFSDDLKMVDFDYEGLLDLLTQENRLTKGKPCSHDAPRRRNWSERG
jgi:hypothetical protein